MSPEVQSLLDSVRSDVAGHLGASDSGSLEGVCYKTQVVNGTNYFIKAKLGDNHHVHLRIHRPFSGSPSLHSVQRGHSAGSDIGFF
jgi:cystatin-A/B